MPFLFVPSTLPRNPNPKHMYVQEVDEQYCISFVFKGDWKAKLRGQGQIIAPDGGSLTKVTVESDDINEDGEEKVVGTFSGLTIGGDYTLEVKEDAVLGAPHPHALCCVRVPPPPLGGPCLLCASYPVQRKRRARSLWQPLEGCRAGKTTSTRASASAWARTALPAPASSGARPAPLSAHQGSAAPLLLRHTLPGTLAPRRTTARTGTTATKSPKRTAGRASAEPPGSEYVHWGCDLLSVVGTARLGCVSGACLLCAMHGVRAFG